MALRRCDSRAKPVRLRRGLPPTLHSSRSPTCGSCHTGTAHVFVSGRGRAARLVTPMKPEVSRPLGPGRLGLPGKTLCPAALNVKHRQAEKKGCRIRAEKAVRS